MLTGLFRLCKLEDMDVVVALVRLLTMSTAAEKQPPDSERTATQRKTSEYIMVAQEKAETTVLAYNQTQEIE